jgi:DNA polymerase-1
VARLSDLRSKFITPYNEAVGADGLLRFEFHQLKGDQFGTVSGRFSSTKPAGAKRGANVQQVFSVENQKRMHGGAYILRELFIPDDGYLMAASDAAQIEYRVFAHMTRSARLLKAYRDDPNVDFHEWTGALVRKHRPDFDRKRLKVFNFMLLFGGGAGKTAEMLGVSEQEGDALREVYGKAFPEARTLMDLAMQTARERGFVRTIMGRRARFPQANRLHAALNRAIQGSAADLNKMKLVALYQKRKELGIKMRMTVHDEVVADVPSDAVPALDAAMNVQEFPLSVPITWSTKAGKNWAEAK